MSFSSLWHYGKHGMDTLLSSISFFYSHATFLLISLIPSCIRAYQMWNRMQVPVLFEIIVELARVFLFLFMICLMSKAKIKSLLEKDFWQRLRDSCSTHLQKNWPNVFIAQIVIFVLFLYGLGNFVLNTIVNISLPAIFDMLKINTADHAADSARSACVFFLKNMSIIPISLVFMLNMFGVKHTKE
jgi:hypothetical protein